MESLAGGWRSYLLERRSDDVRALAEAFPDRRSLYVDIVDLHGFDPDLTEALFADPDHTLSEGTTALRGIDGVSAPLRLRVENNPHQCEVSAIRARHLHELVTVEGRVESTGGVRMAAATARYDCPSCGDSARESPPGIEVDPPARCDACGWDGRFEFRPDDSRFVDLQRIGLAPPSNTREGASPERTLPVFLDGDLVGAVEGGDHCWINGVLRVRRTDRPGFDPYLDAVSVQETHEVASAEGLEDRLEAYWRATDGTR